MRIEVEARKIAPMVTLTIGGVLLGIGLMVVDELFTIMALQGTSTNTTMYFWPIVIPYIMSTNAVSVWTAWEVAFVWIIFSVVLVLISSLAIIFND